MKFLILFLISVLTIFITYYLFPQDYYYNIPLQLTMLFLALALINKNNLKSIIEEIGVGNLKINIIYSVIGIFFLFVILFIIKIFAITSNVDDQENISDKILSLPQYLIFIAIFIAPIIEEILFRVAITKKISQIFSIFSNKFQIEIPQNLNNGVSIILSSLIFGLAHISYGSMIELVGASIIAVFFCLLYFKSKSIIPSIFVHIFNNLMSILVIFYTKGKI